MIENKRDVEIRRLFCERFRILRNQHEMNQDEFSKFLGISRPTVGFYENGERVPDAVRLAQIAQRCNVSSDWLIGLSNMKSPENNKLLISDLGFSDHLISSLKWIAKNSRKFGWNPLEKLILGSTGHRLINELFMLAWYSGIYHKEKEEGLIKNSHKRIEEMLEDNILDSIYETVGRKFRLVDCEDMIELKSYEAEKFFKRILQNIKIDTEYIEIKEDEDNATEEHS